MKFLDYTEWKENQIRAANPTDMVTCPECKGDGEIYHVCDHCDSEVERSCDTCEASGVVEFGELSDSQKRLCFLRTEYSKAVLSDLKKAIFWLGCTVESLGFTVKHQKISGRDYIYRNSIFFGSWKA